MTENQPFRAKKVRALCFDIDGTLSDTDDQFVENISRILHPLRYAFPDHNTRPFARWLVMATETPATTLYTLPDHFGLDQYLNALGNALYRLGLGHSPAPFRLIEGARDVLHTCAKTYPMAIVSARGERSARRFLNQFDLWEYFQCLVTAQTAQHTKPYPHPILRAAKHLGVRPEACLMIGDTTVDIHAARRSGAQSVGVLCGFGKERELRKAGASLILDSTADLPQHLPAVTREERVKKRKPY